MKIKVSKTTLLVSCTLAALLACSTAQAQFGGIPGLGKKDTGGPVIDKDAFGLSVDNATNQVLAARITFLEAKTKLAEALGLKTDSLVKASEALRAKEGPATKSGDKVAAMKDSSKATADVDKQFNEALGKSDELSAESKVKFGEGAGKFIKGVLQERAQIQTIQQLVEQGKALSSSASILDKVKVIGLVKPVTDLSLMVPGDVKEGTSTLGKIMSFAQSHSITNIPDSDKATSDLGDLK